MRDTMQPLLIFDVNFGKKAGKSWENNKYDARGWSINNQTSAVLQPLASATLILEGKNYPTSNLIIPYIYPCLLGLMDGVSTFQPWDRKLLEYEDLSDEVALSLSCRVLYSCTLTFSYGR